MANITFGAVTGNWSDGTKWVGGVKPAAADVAIFDATSAACTCDEATPALGGLTMTGYLSTLTIANAISDIDVNGAAVLDGTIATTTSGDIYCSGNFTKTASMAALPSSLRVTLDGTGTLTCNAVAGGTLINNTAGTITIGDAQLWSSWTNTLGTYTGGAYAHTIVGDIVRTAGACATTGTWTQTGTGNLKWGSSVAGQYPAELVANGTGTLTGTTYISKLSGNGSLSGAQELAFSTSTDNFWAFTGTCSVIVDLFTSTSGISTGAAITIEGKNFVVYNASGANPVLLDGNLNLKGSEATAGNLLLSAGTGAVKIDAGAYSITAAAITIGHATNAVTLDLGTGTHWVSGAISRGAGSPALNFGSSKIKLGVGGTLNGSNITATADAAIVNPPASVVGGTVSNVVYEAGKTLDCSGGYTKDGGGNTTGKFWFGSQAERRHPEVRDRQWGFMAGTRR